MNKLFLMLGIWFYGLSIFTYLQNDNDVSDKFIFMGTFFFGFLYLGKKIDKLSNESN